MRDVEKAAQAVEVLKAAEQAPAQQALPMLNGLAGLVQAEGESALEVEEARHRGQPADRLWPAAIAASERWMALAR
jgi:hypothetical protein